MTIKIEIPTIHADLFHPEFLDVLKVLEFGAKKYSPNGWLHTDPEIAHFTHRSNTASLFRHLADTHARIEFDHETGLDPYLSVACRALMAYTRKKKGLVY